MLDLIGERPTTPPKLRELTEKDRNMLAVVAKVEKQIRARTSFQDFLEYMMPDPQFPDDPNKTKYVSKPVHKLMVQFWEEIDSRKSMRSALSVPPQTGKPVSEDELVLMADGSRKKLKEVSVGDFVITKYGRARRVNEVYKQGELDCVVIKTQTGKKVTAALDHPMLTPGGWVNAGDIKPRMSLMSVIPDFSERDAPTEKERCAARLAGYFVGDGSCGEYDNGKGRMNVSSTITVADDTLLADIQQCCEVLGFDWKVSKCGKKARQIWLSGGVRPWLRKIALAGKVSKTKRVPDFVFKAHNDVVAGFLGAYFACDGTVSKKGLDRQGHPRPDTAVEFYSVSEGLLSDTQHLLLRFGVKSTLEIKKGRYLGDVHFSWRLRIAAQDYVARFMKNIPVFHAKGAVLRESEIYRTQPDNLYIPDPVAEVMIGIRKNCRCLSVEEDKSFLVNDYAVHNTTHTTIMGSAWSLGREPSAKIINGTYNESRAKQNGNNIRRIMNSARYQEVFPEIELTKGGKSKSYLETTAGGYVLMVGRGSGVTGQPCDIFNIDDPIKDKAEAISTAALEEAWEWFSVTANQRCHNLTRISIEHTRWAGMDLIGRICDRDNPDFDEERARGWTYLNVKAYGNEPHIAALMGIEPQDYIWPEKFSPHLLEQIQNLMSAEDFSALYMGKPVPDEGGFFKKAMIQDYQPGQVPPTSELRIYAASDHAVSTKTHGNYTVLIIAGVDKAGQVWLLDCVREKMESDKTVEEMIRLMKRWRPITWFAARDHISKSIGPFLKRRMRDESIYATHVADSPEVGNKMQKAQSIRGMMALGMVRFPRKAHWYSDMVNELLRFRGEGDAQDDQVDALSHLGRGLEVMLRGARQTANDTTETKFKTLAWVQGSTAAKKAEEARVKARAGW